MDYYDAKRAMRKIYAEIQRTVSTINFVAYQLNELEKQINAAGIDSFGRYVLSKEIKSLRQFMDSKNKQKSKKEHNNNEKARK